jgi:hypothetical protein
MRLGILTSPSGVEFDACYADRVMVDMEEIQVTVISLVRRAGTRFVCHFVRTVWMTVICRMSLPSVPPT